MWKKYIKPYRFQAFIGFVFKMIEAFLELMVPLVVANIIDQGIAAGDKKYIIKMGLLLFGLALIGYCCALVCQYFASKTSQGFGTYMRNDMFKIINQYDFDNIDFMKTSSLITRITNDVNQIQLAVAMIIRLVSRSPFIIIGSLIMAFRIDMQLSIIFLFTAPLLGLCIYYFMSKTIPFYIKIQKQLDKVSLICRENLKGMRVIRAFSKQNEEKKKFHDAVDLQKKMQIDVSKFSSLLNPCTTVILNAAIIIVLYVGVYRLKSHAIMQGDIVALINYLNQILLSMIVFANVIVILNKASASYKRVEEVLNLKPHVCDGVLTKDSNSSYIRFEHVDFSYINNQVLNDISFEVFPGETVGIIGGTGAGKSTLMALLMRFYDVNNGSIYVKGHHINEYPIQKLRCMISIVPQDVVLFSGTVRKNLCLGKTNISDEDIKRALEIAQAQFVYDLEEGLDSYIQQNGKNLSGGQRQRLTIARALIQKPEILILDDSSSALDYGTEAALRKAVASLNMTVFVISQRVSSLMHADKIIVLSHGTIVGIGKHSELMNNCSIYREIAASQLTKEEEIWK